MHTIAQSRDFHLAGLILLACKIHAQRRVPSSMCQQSFPSVCLDGLITTLRRYGLHWAGIIEIFASADRIAFVPSFPTGCVRHPRDKSRCGADIPELSLRDPLNLLASRCVPRIAITSHTFVSQPNDHNHLCCQMDILTATHSGFCYIILPPKGGSSCSRPTCINQITNASTLQVSVSDRYCIS